MTRRNHTLGVSLVELLVAIAIITTIFGAVVAMFLSAVRVTKKGSQAIQGFEQARGVFMQLERDLTTAFTARDFGDTTQFYGNPMGMTFVGVAQYAVNPGDIGNAQAGKLCRITWVLYQEPNSAFQLEDRNDPGRDPARPTGVATYSLLRYVENGVADLDDFRVPMPAPGPNGVQYADLKNLKDAAINEFGIGFVSNLFDRSQCINCADMTDEQFERMRLREFWVRLLAGDPLATRDGTLSFWRDVAAYGPTDARPERRDYVVAENIVLPRSRFRPDLDGDGVLGLADWDGSFFFYGITRVGSVDPLLLHYWQSEPNLNILYASTLDGTIESERVGSPLTPRIPEIVHVRIAFGMPSPFPGAPDFLPEAFEQTIEIPSGYIRPRLD